MVTEILHSNSMSDRKFVFLQKAERALHPMKSCNEVFELTSSSEKLSLKLSPAEGNYAMQVDEINFEILLQTPISGRFSYVLCAEKGEWVGSEDGHSLEGLLVRDLIRQCNGYPKF